MPDANDNRKNLNDQDAFDRALIRAREGDGEAVGEMLELCRDYLLLIANQDMDKQMHRKMGPSDLVQESMINAQKHIDRFEGSTKQEFLAWLRGILKKDALHWRRHYRGVQKRGLEQEVCGADSRDVLPEPVDSFLTPGTNAMADEEEVMLKRALEKLPEHYREIIKLRSFEDKSFVEIGKRLDCSADSARKLWSRAIVQLQEILARQSPLSNTGLSPKHDEGRHE